MTDQAYITGLARVLYKRAAGNMTWAQALKQARATLNDIKARDARLFG